MGFQVGTGSSVRLFPYAQGERRYSILIMPTRVEANMVFLRTHRSAAFCRFSFSKPLLENLEYAAAAVYDSLGCKALLIGSQVRCWCPG
jgi:hypothetical protein